MARSNDTLLLMTYANFKHHLNLAVLQDVAYDRDEFIEKAIESGAVEVVEDGSSERYVIDYEDGGTDMVAIFNPAVISEEEVVRFLERGEDSSKFVTMSKVQYENLYKVR